MDIGAATGTTTVHNDLDVDLDVNIDGCDLTTSCATFNLLNATPTTVNFAGAATTLNMGNGSATTVEIGAATGTTSVNNNLDVDLDVNIDGCDLTTSCTTFNLVNATATTVNFAGAGTTIEIGAATGTTNVNNNLDVDLDVNIDGCDLTTSCAAFNLLDATPTTINFGGAATTVDIGAATGTTTVHNNLDVDLDVNVDGGDLTTNQATFNLLDATPTTVNFAGAATTVNIGADTGTTWVDNNLDVEDNLTVDGDTQLGDSCAADTLTVDSLAFLNCDLDIGSAATAEFFVAAADGSLNIGPNNFTVAGGSGNTVVAGTLNVTGLGTFQSGVVVQAGGLTINAGGANITGASTINGNLGLGANNITMTGDIATGGARVNKGWFEDIDVNDLIVNTSVNMNDLLDFTDFADAMTVDAATTIDTTAGLDFTGAGVTISGGDLAMGSNNISGVNTITAAIGNLTAVNSTTVSSTTINAQSTLNVNGIMAMASSTFTDLDATPDVSGDSLFYTANTGATTITTFDNPTAGQIIYIIFGDGNTTLQDGATLVLNGSANWTPAATDTITLVYDGTATAWVEISRSDNS